MASKVAQEASTEDIAEMLEAVDKILDRLKTLYEQYFLGIQKQAPAFMHSDVERKLRDLTQIQIRNTGLRYRFTTISSKFGSYNAYWRRTIRQIENGTYTRNLHKIGRDAVRSGAEIPEEILAAMPKRMRDQVVRDREQALAIAARRNKPELVEGDVEVELDEMPPEATDDLIAMIKEPTAIRRDLKTRGGAHILDANDSDLDIDAFFAEVEAEPEAPDNDDAHSTQKRAPVRPTDPPPGQRQFGVDPRRTGTQPGIGQTDANATSSDPRRTGSQPGIDPRRTGSQPAIDPRRTGSQPAIDPNARATSQSDPRRSDSQPGDPRRTGSQPNVDPRRTGSQPDPNAPRTTGQRPLARPPSDPNAAVEYVTRPTAASEPLARPPTPAPVRPQVPAPARPGVPAPGRPGVPMPSQATKPNPIAPGSAAARGDVPVESMSGPFPRAPLQTPMSGMSALPKPGTAIPRPTATTPSGGMPAIPRPMVMTPSGGMPAIPKPMSSGNSGPIKSGNSGPTSTSASAPASAAPASAASSPVAKAPSPATSATSGPSASTSAATAIPVGTAPRAATSPHTVARFPADPRAASSPATSPHTDARPPADPRAASSPHTIARAASSPHTVPRAATQPGIAAPARSAPDPTRPARPDTDPGIPMDMQEETPAIVTQTRPTVRAQSPRPGTGPARAVTGQPARPASQPKLQPAPQRPPPGMTDADVNALYAKYVKAKEMVGEKIGPGEHNKLLKTINAQAPKIMQQYNAKAVDFSVVVKDNQVIIRAKPKT